MRRVLVALKEEREASHLAAVTAAMAQPGDEIHVVHVIESAWREDASGAAALVDGAAERLRARGLVATGEAIPLLGGSVAGRLADRAGAGGAGLVVMGSRGLGHVGGLFGRSVSHALMASTHLPVLVMPDAARPPLHGFRRVLVALREKGEAPAVAGAISLLRGPTDVLAVHVPRRVAIHVGHWSGETYAELPETSDVVLQAARRSLREVGITARTHRMDHAPDVARAITEVAAEWDADVLVLGSRRLRDWEAVLAGSTCHDVIRLGHRPVLVAGRVGR